jgi:hypothetical protein
VRNVRVGELNLPDAVATPSGMPDVSQHCFEAANAQLLWHIVREAARLADRTEAHVRNGVAGWLWRGDPKLLAKRAWDGLDDSDLANETLSTLYESLNASGHMARLDTGNQFRRWWVADKWDKMGTYPRVVSPKAETVPVFSSNGSFVSMDPAPPTPADITPEPQHADYAAVLQGLLYDYEAAKAEVRKLRISLGANSDRDDLAAEVDRLRGVCDELRASNTELRQQKAAFDRILGER